MFDINTIVSQAIKSAVDDHILALKQEHANTVGAMAALIAKLSDRLDALEAPSADQPAPKPQTAGGYLDEYYLSKAYKEQFVEHLDCQEWFWGKVNDYVQEAMERYGATDSDGVKAVVKIALADERQELKQELFDELKEDLTDELREEFESEIDDKISTAIDDIDLHDNVSRLLRNASVSIDI
jgi:hypothetical protein